VTAAHWYVLRVYFVFTLIATSLALAKRWLRRGSGEGHVWRKYPTYILINLCFLAASWLSSNWHTLTVLLAVVGGLASWEITCALVSYEQSESRGDENPNKTLHLARNYFVLFPYATAFLIVIADWLEIAIWLRVWLVVFLLYIMLSTLIQPPRDYGRRVLAISASVIYFPICLVAYILIQKADASGFATVFLYLTVATNDALAQITGELFGVRPLVPHISPAKTVEGAVGGILFSGAMGMMLSSTIGWSYLTGILMGLIVGVVGLIGDLTASVWKRALGLKNFSQLLGAQGGVLDRFDGLIFAGPVFYLLYVIAF